LALKADNHGGIVANKVGLVFILRPDRPKCVGSDDCTTNIYRKEAPHATGEHPDPPGDCHYGIDASASQCCAANELPGDLGYAYQGFTPTPAQHLARRSIRHLPPPKERHHGKPRAHRSTPDYGLSTLAKLLSGLNCAENWKNPLFFKPKSAGQKPSVRSMDYQIWLVTQPRSIFSDHLCTVSVLSNDKWVSPFRWTADVNGAYWDRVPFVEHTG
jgi:hypothetical protein